MSDNVTIYNLIGINNLDNTSGISIPIGYLPTPNESDYSSGMMSRLFVKKINTGIITEVETKLQSKISRNQFYTFYKIDWKISGARNNKYKDNTLLTEGVEEYNLNKIQELKDNNFNKIEVILNNPLQFWRGF